eukprot:365352-Chlamydomonas_euryale.AAC.2
MLATAAPDFNAGAGKAEVRTSTPETLQRPPSRRRLRRLCEAVLAALAAAAPRPSRPTVRQHRGRHPQPLPACAAAALHNPAPIYVRKRRMTFAACRSAGGRHWAPRDWLPGHAATAAEVAVVLTMMTETAATAEAPRRARRTADAPTRTATEPRRVGEPRVVT